MKALFVFTPNESKRLIGKAVAATEEVKRALKKANIMVSHGSTSVYVLEEILGKEQKYGMALALMKEAVAIEDRRA